MKIVFTFSDKSKITLSEQKAREVMDSPNNIVMISDDNGKWTGLTVNKSFIINTVAEYDDALGVGTIIDEDRQISDGGRGMERVVKTLDRLKEEKPWIKKT